MNKLCLFCRDKSKPDEKRRRLFQIQRYLRKMEPAKGDWYINWGIRFRCKYGIGCPSLDVQRMEMERLARSLTPLMRQAAVSGSKRQFYGLLQILQGEFPQAYRQMIEWRAGRKKLNEGNDDENVC